MSWLDSKYLGLSGMVILVAAMCSCATNYRNARVDWAPFETKYACPDAYPFRVRADGSVRCRGSKEPGFCGVVGKLWAEEFAARFSESGCGQTDTANSPLLEVHLKEIRIEGGPYNTFNYTLMGLGVLAYYGGVLPAAILKEPAYIPIAVAGATAMGVSAWRLWWRDTDYAVTATAELTLSKGGVPYWSAVVHSRRVEAHSGIRQKDLYLDGVESRDGKPVLSRAIGWTLTELNKKIVTVTARLNKGLREGGQTVSLTPEPQ